MYPVKEAISAFRDGSNFLAYLRCTTVIDWPEFMSATALKRQLENL
jgi:hypothetical protein